MDLVELLSIIGTAASVLGVVILGGFKLYNAITNAQHREFDRIDKKFEKVDEKFDRIDEKFDRIDEKFEKVDEKFDRIDGKLDKILDVLTTLSNAVTRIDTQQQEHDKKLEAMSTHGERIAAIEARQPTYTVQQPVDASPSAQPVVAEAAKQPAAAS